MLKIGILLVLAFVCVSASIDVKFCSEPHFQGSCATKDYDNMKCEHLPWRFRWIYNVKSMRVKSNFLGICNAQCELHTLENCGRSLFSMLTSQQSNSIPFDCNHPVVTITTGLAYKGMICNGGGFLG